MGDIFVDKLLTCGFEKGTIIICICEPSVYDHGKLSRSSSSIQTVIPCWLVDWELFMALLRRGKLAKWKC